MMAPKDIRASLDDRLRRQGSSLGGPAELNRVRKEIALQRLLARLRAVTPDGSWTLKGGMSLVARLGAHARTTQDADANWRQAAGSLAGYLKDACALDLGDGFSFILRRQQPLQTDTAEGGVRCSFIANLSGRVFEQAITLDVNFDAGDRRPVEWVQLSVPPTAEIGLGPVEVPAIPIGQQLAEKLHAYLQMHGDARSSRSRDLVDTLVVAKRLPIPERRFLADDCSATFRTRGHRWPEACQDIPGPPADWQRPWAEFVTVYGLEWRTLPVAFAAFEGFWVPVIEYPGERGAWDARRWEWR
jgi:hypothetical protein